MVSLRRAAKLENIFFLI